MPCVLVSGSVLHIWSSSTIYVKRGSKSDNIHLILKVLEIKSEEHFVFRCPRYYKIQGRFHCLFWNSGGSPATSFCNSDQICLALYVRKAVILREETLQDLSKPSSIRRITYFLSTYLCWWRCKAPSCFPHESDGSRPMRQWTSSRLAGKCVTSTRPQSRTHPIWSMASQVSSSNQTSIMRFFPSA